ncbi:MAG: type II secretion system protein N [Exilibacterium sp.]
MVSGINIKLLIVICVFLWLGMVISNTPAVWGAWMVQQAGPVQMSQVSGSLWSGRAAEVVLKVDRKPFLLGALKWDLNPLSLLILRPCADVNLEAEGQNMRANLCAGFGGLQLSQGDLKFSAGVLTPWLPTQISGLITARIAEAGVDSHFNVNELAGNLSWSEASVYNGSEWMALGAYSADLSVDGNGGIIADVIDRGGPLQLRMQVLAKEGLALKGSVLLRKDAPPAIQQSLPLVGDKQADGSYAIDMSL